MVNCFIDRARITHYPSLIIFARQEVALLKLCDVNFVPSVIDFPSLQPASERVPKVSEWASKSVWRTEETKICRTF